MTLKSYLWGMRIITLVSVIAWISVIYNIDPSSSGIVGLILFYASLFVALSGISILSLIWFKRKVSRDREAFVHLGMSFRQGILVSLLVVILLIFQSFKILVWWDGLLVVAGIFLIELYFLSR